MKKLISPTLLILLGVVAGYLAASNNASGVSHLNIHENLIAGLKSENAALKAQLEKLESSPINVKLHDISSNSFAISQSKPEKITAEKSVKTPGSEKNKLRILEQKIALMEIESFIKDISQDIGSVGYQAFIGQRQEKFLSEAVDPVWARTEEESIYEIFLSAPELADVALVNTECKSLQCRISLSVATTAMSNEAVADISRLLAKDKGNLYHWVNYDPQKNITEVYISTHVNSFNSDGLGATH